MKIMASGPITSWEIEGKKVKIVTDFIFLGSKITADSDCSHDIKRHLLLGRKPFLEVKTDLDIIEKQRHHFADKGVQIVKAMIFPVFMYRYESWTIKKAECWRIDAFELWCWRRLLRVPWTTWRSNRSILKENSLKYSLEGLMLKLKLQYFGTWCKEPAHWNRPWCWEKLRAGEGDRRWGGWMASLTEWTWVWANSGK